MTVKRAMTERRTRRLRRAARPGARYRRLGVAAGRGGNPPAAVAVHRPAACRPMAAARSTGFAGCPIGADGARVGWIWVGWIWVGSA